MGKPTDISVVSAVLYFIPVPTRVPLEFGAETLTTVTCARVCATVADARGRRAVGWGETPLRVQWVWPGTLTYESRHQALKEFCVRLADAWVSFSRRGHPMEIGRDFLEEVLRPLLDRFNQERRDLGEPMPWLAALVCCSAFDLAVHDGFGQLHQQPVYATYNAEFMSRDLAAFLTPAEGIRLSFKGKFPADFLIARPPIQLRAWHLVGELDLLRQDERRSTGPKDGSPLVLTEWIQRDGLKCLKVKLRGNDGAWDYDRLAQVGMLAEARNVEWLSADFNGTVTDPAYVNDLLDQLRDEHPRLYGMLLYVGQPFPYELAHHRIDAHSVSARKPLFLDESAHDWEMVRLGRELGWSGVALKTCKTQTGAILSACWARAHGMTLMVQDVTNPMLAQIPHALLAAHVGTIMGLETNNMQFCPGASAPEATVHPGLYQRRQGCVDLSTVNGPGFGYRAAEIPRQLAEPVAVVGR